MILGVLYELKRIRDKITVHISSPFGSAIMAAVWPTFSTEYVGETILKDDQISMEGCV